jgi:lysophospholipase L1-like esterase
MPGKRIKDLTALSGAGSANDDDVVIFDTTADTTKRISRSQLAEGMQSDVQVLTNKTLALGSNTVTGTTAQFNTALTDGDFATLAGSGVLTNKTIDSASNTLTVNYKEAQVETSNGSRTHLFTTVAALLADTGTYTTYATGQIVEAGGFRYTVAATGATDHHVITAGSVKLYVLPDQNGFLSVEALGAVGDGLTSGATAFAKAESITAEAFHVSDGIFVSGLSVATKNYAGAGAIRLTSGRNTPGQPSGALTPRYIDPMHKMNASQFVSSPRNLVFVGDSITYGFGVTEVQAYPNLLATMLNQRGPSPSVDKAIGATMLTRAIQAGTIAAGNKGPLGQSLILDVGASLTFTVSLSDYVGFWFRRAVGAGTITTTVNGITVDTFSCAGAAADDVFRTSGFYRAVAGAATIVMTASVASVELTGAYFSRNLPSGAVSVVNQAASGYSTADFTSATILTSIGAQTTYSGSPYPLYVIALGTNDIYNPSKAVSRATFKSNLDAICVGLRTYGIPVLTVPLRAVQTTYSPVLESFEEYRNAVYEVARKYGYAVVDLSEYDLNSTGGYQADGLHPSNIGHSLLAAIYWEKLNLAAANHQLPSGTLTMAGSYSAFGSNYGLPSYQAMPSGMVMLSGFISTGGSAKNTTVTTIPEAVRPSRAHLFTVGGLNGAAGASVTVQVNPSGIITMYDYSSASLTQFSLDGITFPTA